MNSSDMPISTIYTRDAWHFSRYPPSKTGTKSYTSCRMPTTRTYQEYSSLFTSSCRTTSCIFWQSESLCRSSSSWTTTEKGRKSTNKYWVWSKMESPLTSKISKIGSERSKRSWRNSKNIRSKSHSKMVLAGCWWKFKIMRLSLFLKQGIISSSSPDFAGDFIKISCTNPLWQYWQLLMHWLCRSWNTLITQRRKQVVWVSFRIT